MTVSRALVSGAGIAGLATAYWLDRAGWEVQVVERASAFRDGGQNIDIRGTARQVIAAMSLEEAVRERNTTEEGTAVLDGAGRVLARFSVDDPDGPTAELEILRGDLARLLLDRLPGRVTVRYGEEIEAVRDGDSSVEVALRSGAAEAYDLLVIAEGVRSRTRDLVFGSAVTRRELGLNMAYGTIPRTGDDDRWWRWYFAAGSRQVTLRPDDRGTTRATLAYLTRGKNLADLAAEQAVGELREVFRGAGGPAERVLAGFAGSDDVYFDCLTQIMMPAWSAGRVCLTGDAAWCVTPLGGGGTSLALTGAYVLAACLSQGGGSALDRYEQWMRPLITDAQKLPPGTPRLFYPRSAAGVRALRLAARVAGTVPFRKLTGRLGHVAHTDQQLPPLQPHTR